MRRSTTDLRRSTRMGALCVALAMVATACGSTPADEVRISVKRIALSLAFEDEELAKPVEPQRIIQIIPAPPELLATGDLTPYHADREVPLRPEPPLCATAPPDAALTEAVEVTIDEPPKPGWYRRHNRGKVGIAGGAIPLSIPLPSVTLMEIRDVHEVTRPDFERQPSDVAQDEAPPVADAAGGIAGTVTATRFTVAHQIATITVTDVYEYDDSSLRLVQRTTATRDATAVFTPTPQIALVELGNFGNEWSEGGADRESNTAMVVEGAITKQERVDVCGELVDSLRFENDEQAVNLQTQEVAGTSDVPNAYNIAPHRRGLIIREEKHFTQVVTVDDAKLVLEWDYVSTLGNFEPYPTREDAVKAVFSR